MPMQVYQGPGTSKALGLPEHFDRYPKLKTETSPLVVVVLDTPGQGGAYHHYEVFNPANPRDSMSIVDFQNGPLGEYGRNGIGQEELLAIVQHRLQCFQSGPFACQENQEALFHVQTALEALERRTLERRSRGVEGQNKL